MKTLKLIAALVAATALASANASDKLERGARAYATCAGCHGFAAEGNAQVAAPMLAGQPAAYLARQIRNYRSGARGYDRADTPGQTMATMSRALGGDDDVDAVAAYVASLPRRPAPNEPVVSGDAGHGKTLYAGCAACHGGTGEGLEAMGGPRLAGQSGWDMLNQLRKFANGQRGTHPDDTYGKQMAAASAMLADETAMQDVIAYIGTLDDPD